MAEFDDEMSDMLGELEAEGQAGPEGDHLLGEGQPEGGPADEGEAAELPEYFIGELTQDDVLGRLESAKQSQEPLKALESRAFGKMGSLEESLRALQSAIPTQPAFDPEKLAKVKEYDPDLYAALREDLSGALSVAPLDENVLKPHLDRVREDIISSVRRTLIEGMNLDLDEFIPSNWEKPETDRQKAYTDWYAIQPYEVQRALIEQDPVGASRAFKAFREWEAKQKEQAEAAAQAKRGKLARGVPPKADSRPPRGRGIKSEEEAFLSVFKD